MKIGNDIIRGKLAFETMIYKGEEALIPLADSYGIKLQTLKSYISTYANRVVNPKPTEQELELYYEVLKKKRQKNASQFNYQTNPEHYNRLYKEKKDFSLAEELIELNSKAVSDYLDIIINSELTLQPVVAQLNSYVRYHNDETKKVKKVTLLLKHIEKNREYINAQRRLKSSEANKDNYKQKIVEMLEKNFIDGSQSIESLMNEYKMSTITFYKYLSELSTGTPEEQLLHTKFIEKQEEEDILINESSKIIYDYINEGIIKNGEKSKFTILDYYRIINYSPEQYISKLWSRSNKIELNRSRILKIVEYLKLISRNNTLCTEEQILDLHYAYNGVTIDDVGVKTQIIDYIKSMGIPLYSNVYYATAEEYLKGYLTLNSMTLE